MTALDTYRDILTAEFHRRQERNPRYSLRAFAAFLGMSPAHLSQVMSGKRSLSFRTAEALAERLNLNPGERQRALGGLGPVRQRLTETESFYRLKEQEFETIASWEDYAVLGLASLESNKAEARWIAERVGLSVAQARVTLNRLVKLGLLSIEAGRFFQTGRALTTTQDVRSAAIRQFHRGLLGKAVDTLDTVELDRRDFGAIIMAIDPSKLPQAKKRLQQFRRELCAELEDGSRKEVYALSLQLFPLSKPRRKS